MPLGNMMATFLLICHGLLALFLLGAISHQALARPEGAKPGPRSGFLHNLRSVRAAAYTNAVVVLYVIVAVLGGAVYTTYRVKVRPTLESASLWSVVGIFELKEHLTTLGLAVLPAYWYYWQPSQKSNFTRRALTIFLALTVWWAFLVGHVVNNARGFGL
jgi:hypothetical protein